MRDRKKTFTHGEHGSPKITTLNISWIKQEGTTKMTQKANESYQ